MKKIFILPMLISFATICSCQKQDSAADVQLAQQKAELNGREKALDERLNSLDERVSSLDQRLKALTEKKAAANTGLNPADVQHQTPDPAQVQAERERTIQQFSAEMRARVADDSKMKAERDRKRQLGPEDLQRQWQQNLDKAKMSGKAVFPAAKAGSPTPSPAVEATSPTTSPAVEATSPTSSPTPQ
jgi:chromosome segregation ATPase